MTDDASSNEFRERFLALRDSENAKNKLIDELLSNLDALSQNFQQISFDREREIYVNREIQREKKLLSDEIRKMKASSARRSKSLPLEREVDCEQDRNPFIVVLIDGDGTIFQDSLLQQGEAGGREAAGLLWSAIRQYAERDLADLPSDCKIVARIYANIKGLAETCHKAGIVDHPTKVVDFARGFTRSKHLFDFIDVGSGKDRADDKLAEVFKLHLYDGHCRQIIFGCSHDNGYARLLEEYFADQATASRISLLEGVPFERELEGLRPGFKNTRIDSLFRNTKINLQAQQYQPQYQPPAAPQQQSVQFGDLCDTKRTVSHFTYVMGFSSDDATADSCFASTNT
ncbi:MAG: hypothetical protein M1833_002270 [Piccolia ochrophora]|nr:MAG: hypothetical protein M1833_002270 [Piccolia ochrophora]